MVEVATLQALLATEPSAFVAARTELAKQLRSDGDRDGADAVKALRRLGVADWALNVAAGEQAELAAAFGDAAADVLDAQAEAMAGRGGGDLRTRLKTLRTRSGELVSAAAAVAERHGQRGVGSSALDIGARLSEIGANRAAIDLLRDGLIGAADPGAADPFGVVGGTRSPDPSPSPAKARKATKAQKSPKAGKPSGGEAAQPNELERRRAERRARADAEQAAKAAASALAAADGALAKSRAVAAKAAGRVADAEARLAEAVEARDAADAALADAEATQRRAADEAERSAAALSAQDTA